MRYVLAAEDCERYVLAAVLALSNPDISCLSVHESPPVPLVCNICPLDPWVVGKVFPDIVVVPLTVKFPEIVPPF